LAQELQSEHRPLRNRLDAVGFRCPTDEQRLPDF